MCCDTGKLRGTNKALCRSTGASLSSIGYKMSLVALKGTDCTLILLRTILNLIDIPGIKIRQVYP